MDDSGPLELEASAGEFKPSPDKRPRMEQPLPVKLVAVGDVLLKAAAGQEQELDALYVRILQFLKADDDAPGRRAYWADNFRLIFELSEQPPRRESYRSAQIQVESLAEVERQLVEAEIEYVRQRGLVPGQESLALLDPGGNWIEIIEARALM